MKKIYFVLPGFSRRPIGGYKIILKYANLLASENYEVRIVYLEGNRYPKYSWKWLILNYWTKKGPDWIKLNSSIKTYTIKDLKKAMIETNSEDIAIASSVETVSPTETLFSNAKKFYFIQDLEDWNVDKEYLFETYNKDFTNITISRWLKEVVDKHTMTSKKTEYIRNRGLDESVCKHLIKQALEIQPATMPELLEVLDRGALSAVLTPAQKNRKVSNLLQKMKADGSIVPEGPRNRAKWHLVKNDKT